MIRCRRCVLPSYFPHADLDASGVCYYCRSYRQTKGTDALKIKKARKEFESLLRQYRDAPYQVLLCYSGGKDSTYSLSVLRQKYGLRVLAFTFDNGFLPAETYRNIARVTGALGVDHLFFKGEPALINPVFKTSLKRNIFSPKVVERASAVCTSCIGQIGRAHV